MKGSSSCIEEQIYHRWIKLFDWRLQKRNYSKLAIFAKINSFSGVCLTIRRNCELHFSVVYCKKNSWKPSVQINSYNTYLLRKYRVFQRSKIFKFFFFPILYGQQNLYRHKENIGFLIIYNFGNKNKWLVKC